MKHVTAITNALNTIYTALEPLAPKDRRNVIDASLLLLDGQSAEPSPVPPVKRPPTPKVTNKPTKAKTVAPLVVSAEPAHFTAGERVWAYFKARPGEVVHRGDLLKTRGAHTEQGIDMAIGALLRGGGIVRRGRGQYVFGVAKGSKP